MNIDDLTLGQLKEIKSLVGDNESASKSRHVGKKCIIRTYASGVHFGTLVSQNGRKVELDNARRLWRWDVKADGVSLSEVAVYGPTGDRTKICANVKQIDIVDALEVIPCEAAAIDVIEGAEVYKP